MWWPKQEEDFLDLVLFEKLVPSSLSNFSIDDMVLSSFKLGPAAFDGGGSLFSWSSSSPPRDLVDLQVRNVEASSSKRLWCNKLHVSGTPKEWLFCPGEQPCTSHLMPADNMTLQVGPLLLSFAMQPVTLGVSTCTERVATRNPCGGTSLKRKLFFM